MVRRISRAKAAHSKLRKMNLDPRSKHEILADYRELLQIVKNRPAGILTQSETNRLIACLERCIAEAEGEPAASPAIEKSKLTG
jgi:hypothetical protein